MSWTRRGGAYTDFGIMAMVGGVSAFRVAHTTTTRIFFQRIQRYCLKQSSNRNHENINQSRRAIACRRGKRNRGLCATSVVNMQWTTPINNNLDYDLKSLRRVVGDMGLEWQKHHQILVDNQYYSAERVVWASAQNVALLRGVGPKMFKLIDEFRTQLIHHIQQQNVRHQ